MNAEERIIRWIFRGSLVIGFVTAATTVIGWTQRKLSLVEIALFFVAGLANAAARFMAQGVGSRTIRVMMTILAFGCIFAAFALQTALLSHPAFQPDLTFLAVHYRVSALFSGVLALSCIFPARAAAPVLRKLRQLQADHARSVSTEVPPFA